ncbi:MAG: acyl-ACP--UDP-N-acetylglucosamine O-acyltransferase [Candidatus Aminicenantes bacterium]|nr:acyl-ACP--UDP-N-acetylglucosamine O-acyltransferase [Candidatus Aminicenantes bacterium]
MSSRDVFIHPTAQVHQNAQLDKDVFIGPYSIISEAVSIEKGTRLQAHVCVTGYTKIGKNCLFSHYVSVGTEPQDFTYKQEPCRVIIGDRNVFREFITVNRGTKKGGQETRVGDDNYFMAYSHIAHDCVVGSHTIFINGATLGGHCFVDDYAQIGGLSGLHPFCRVGKYSFIGGQTVVTQDILPFTRVAGSRPTHFYGINAVGLRRGGFSRERIKIIKQMYALIIQSNLNTRQAVDRIKKEIEPCEDRKEMLDFISSSKRGILKKQK